MYVLVGGHWKWWTRICSDFLTIVLLLSAYKVLFSNLVIKGRSTSKYKKKSHKMEEQETRISVRVRSKREILIEESTPYVLCVFANICIAGLNIVTKVSLDHGMNRYELLVYSNAFGTLASAPLALIFERFIFSFSFFSSFSF